MNKLLLVAVGVAVVVGGSSFYGGMKYARGRTPQRQQFTANAAAGFRGGAGGQARGGMNGGFTAGEILSKDDKSITVKMTDGGSKIIFYSSTTEMSKFAAGSAEDLVVGKSVSINGTANQDGSITARTIQLRPIPSPSPVPTK